ncbi:hypothetical protein CBR_g25896 [Chara braunii]|uniref:Uncharacterized protein n=1 Tax=Chara braunii TaxID=69332 RepID=A0A388L6N8_CHABU|nr:hypothetical protein CBR_g25896 [Chara braunii]|eukprot:GBG77965.1 hypothetical protein CBR_g25896 [Chara braunii]
MASVKNTSTSTGPSAPGEGQHLPQSTPPYFHSRDAPWFLDFVVDRELLGPTVFMRGPAIPEVAGATDVYPLDTITGYRKQSGGLLKLQTNILYDHCRLPFRGVKGVIVSVKTFAGYGSNMLLGHHFKGLYDVKSRPLPPPMDYLDLALKVPKEHPILPRDYVFRLLTAHEGSFSSPRETPMMKVGHGSVILGTEGQGMGLAGGSQTPVAPAAHWSASGLTSPDAGFHRVATPKILTFVYQGKPSKKSKLKLAAEEGDRQKKSRRRKSGEGASGGERVVAKQYDEAPTFWLEYERNDNGDIVEKETPIQLLIDPGSQNDAHWRMAQVPTTLADKDKVAAIGNALRQWMSLVTAADEVFRKGMEFYGKWVEGKLLGSDGKTSLSKPGKYMPHKSLGLQAIPVMGTKGAAGETKMGWLVRVPPPPTKKKKQMDDKFFVVVKEPDMFCWQCLADMTNAEKLSILEDILALRGVFVQSAGEHMRRRHKPDIKDMVATRKVDRVMLRMFHYILFLELEEDVGVWRNGSQFFRNQEELLVEFAPRGLMKQERVELRKHFQGAVEYVNTCKRCLPYEKESLEETKKIYDNDRVGQTVFFLGKAHASVVWELLRRGRNVVAVEDEAKMIDCLHEFVKTRVRDPRCHCSFVQNIGERNWDPKRDMYWKLPENKRIEVWEFLFQRGPPAQTNLEYHRRRNLVFGVLNGYHGAPRESVSNFLKRLEHVFFVMGEPLTLENYGAQSDEEDPFDAEDMEELGDSETFGSESMPLSRVVAQGEDEGEGGRRRYTVSPCGLTRVFEHETVDDQSSDDGEEDKDYDYEPDDKLPRDHDTWKNDRLFFYGKHHRFTMKDVWGHNVVWHPRIFQPTVKTGKWVMATKEPDGTWRGLSRLGEGPFKRKAREALGGI